MVGHGLRHVGDEGVGLRGEGARGPLLRGALLGRRGALCPRRSGQARRREGGEPRAERRRLIGAAASSPITRKTQITPPCGSTLPRRSSGMRALMPVSMRSASTPQPAWTRDVLDPVDHVARRNAGDAGIEPRLPQHLAGAAVERRNFRVAGAAGEDQPAAVGEQRPPIGPNPGSRAARPSCRSWDPSLDRPDGEGLRLVDPRRAGAGSSAPRRSGCRYRVRRACASRPGRRPVPSTGCRWTE